MGENSCIKEVKDKIQEIGVLCEQSLPFIAQAYDGLHGVSCTMDNIYDLSKYVDEISSALSTLSKVCVGLSAVPIVGVIAQQIPRIINPVKDVLIATKKECEELGKTAKNIENTLSKVSHEVDMLHQKMVFVSQHYQGYEESLEMMDNVLRLFEGIRELCSQSELAKNLENISDKIEKEVGHVIDTIQELQKQVEELKKR